MGVIQELFTICIILSSVYVSDALSPYLYGSSLPHNYKKYQRINVESNGQSDCFCFDRPQTYTSVPDLIDPHRNGLKRVVLYLYQNTVTNEIRMYTPNIEKQQHIPDLALDDGEALETISNDKIISAIFYNNPNAITLAQSDGDIENCSDELNEPASYGKKNKRCKIHKLMPSPNDYKKINSLEKKVSSSTEDEWPQSREEPIIEHIIPHKTIHSPCILNHPHHVNDMKEIDSRQMLISEENIPESESIVNYPKQNLFSGELGKDNVNLDLQRLSDTNKFQKKRPLNDQLSQVLAEVGIYNDTSSSNVYGSFNKWFVNQMHRTDISGSMKSNFIDVLELKRLIEDILTEHNMIVSPDGVLTDSKGKALDTGNLKLRPILIGDLLEYENLIKDNSDNNKLRLPADLPYLEALLISSVNPPKVIGIIPMGKTYIPRESPDPTSTFPANEIPDKTGSVQKESYVQKLYKNRKSEKKIDPLKSRRKPYGQLTGRLREFLDREKEMNSQTKMLRANTSKNIGSSKSRPKNFMKAHPSDNVESTENIDKLAIAKKERKRYLSDRKLDKLLDKLSNILHEESKEVEPGAPREEGFAVDPRRVGDGPGFRIIGGLPATSSGSPISNRGRSGVISYPLSGGYGGYGGYSGYHGYDGRGGYGGYGGYGGNSLYGNRYGYG